MNRSLPPLLALLFAIAPLPAQERPDGSLAPIGSVAAISSQELVLSAYSPIFFDLGQLEQLAVELFGDRIVVEERDNHQKVLGETSLAQFITFGRSLLIRNSLDAGERITRTLEEMEEREKQLEEASQRQRLNSEAQRIHDQKRSPENALMTAEIQPRHVSIDLLERSLQSYLRSLDVVDGDGNASTRLNFNWIHPSNLLLVEETPTRLDEIRALVARIDRPFPQVHVTALILQASGANGGPTGVPADLAKELAVLVPGSNFALLSSGVLRCSIRSDQTCQLATDSDRDSQWDLSFRPSAFDPESGTLDLSDCAFSMVRNATTPVAGADGASAAAASQRFQTNLTAQLGEWAVIGAVGAQPVLVALRIDRVRESQSGRGR